MACIGCEASAGRLPCQAACCAAKLPRVHPAAAGGVKEEAVDAFASAFGGLSLDVLFLDFAVRRAELLQGRSCSLGMCACSAAAVRAAWPRGLPALYMCLLSEQPARFAQLQGSAAVASALQRAADAAGSDSKQPPRHLIVWPAGGEAPALAALDFAHSFLGLLRTPAVSVPEVRGRVG